MRKVPEGSEDSILATHGAVFTSDSRPLAWSLQELTGGGKGDVGKGMGVLRLISQRIK